MKQTKRILALVLIIAMLTSVLCISAFAAPATTDYQFELGAVEYDTENHKQTKTEVGTVEPGDLIVLEFKIANLNATENGAINGYKTVIDYDKDVLELAIDELDEEQDGHFYADSIWDVQNGLLVTNKATSGELIFAWGKETDIAVNKSSNKVFLRVLFKVKSDAATGNYSFTFDTKKENKYNGVNDVTKFSGYDYSVSGVTPPPVTKTLSSIAVTTAPSKTEYVYNDNFDDTGMVITATYDDESSAVVTGWTVTDGTALPVGKTSVEISYTEGDVTKTAPQAITVGKATPTVTTDLTAEVTYGDTVDNSVIKGEMTVEGTFAWHEVSDYGNWGTKTLYADFTPTDTTNYNNVQNIPVAVKVRQKKSDVGTVSQNGTIYDSYTREQAAKKLTKTGTTPGSFELSGSGPLVTGSYDWQFTPDDPNYARATGSVNLTITPDTVEKIEITTNPTKTEYTYGDPIETNGMVVKATYASGETNDNYTNYTIDPEQVLTVGESVAITVKSKDVTTVTTSFNVKVVKATPIVKTPLTASVTYDDTVDNSDIEGAMDVAGTFAWASGTTTYGDAGTTTLKADFTPGDVTNYNVVQNIDVAVTVAQAEPDVGTVSQNGTIYDSYTRKQAAEKLTKTGTTPGSFELSGSGPLVTGSYDWQFKPKDSTNYETATGTVELTITPDTLTKIEITQRPSKLAYVYSETLDTTGMKVKATYASGEVNEDYKAYTVSPTVFTTVSSEIKIIVTSEDQTQTDTFAVSVDKATYKGMTELSVSGMKDSTNSANVSALLAEGTTGAALGMMSGDASIFAGDPYITVAEGKLHYTISPTAEVGENATVTFNVSGTNYKDYPIVFLVTVVDKTLAVVSDVQLSKSVYNYGESYRVIGTPVALVDGSPVEVENWKYELKYYDASSVWVDAENTKKIGDYKLVVSIDDPNYMGSTELNFKVQPLVTLQKGGEIKFTAETTDVLGNFDFGAQIIPAGTYNLVHETADRIVTKLYFIETGEFSGSMDVSIGSSSNSCVVIEDPQAWKVCVGGLDALAEAELGGMPGSVQLVINSQTVDPSDSAKLAELSEAAGKSLQCMNVRITKTEGGMVQPDITDTNGYPVTMVVPFNPAVMKDIVVLRCHNGEAEAMPTSTMGNDFFLVDYENGEITIVSTQFSTFAIAYTPADPFYPVYPVTPVPVVEQFVILPSELELTSFYDVVQGDWFYDAVYYCQRMGLMTGTSYRTFSPNGTTTRAMIMTILARQSGVDTQGLVWYERGVEWCRNVGISDGSNPMADITREQFAAMLYRYAQFRNLNTTVRGSLAGFKDAAEVSSYAVTAVQWAVDNGIITGSNGYLLPKATATRAQVAAMFYRFLLNF